MAVFTARALSPLLRSVAQTIMHADAHILSKMRDAARPTKDGNLDLAGGRWCAGDQPKHTKVVQLIQQHVGAHKCMAVDGTSITVHAGIYCTLLSIWYIETFCSNKIGLTNKEVELCRRLWDNLPWIGIRCSGNPQCGCIGHMSMLCGLRALQFLYFFEHPHRKADCGVPDGHPPFISTL